VKAEPPLVSASRLAKTYRVGDVDVPALRDVEFTIDPGAFVAFVGPSGSGKTTLLNLIGCLDKPTGGRLSILDTDVATLDRRRAAEFRGANIGFIFQDFNLIPVLSARENVEYLDGKLACPFVAECIRERRPLPLKMGERVTVTGMLDDDEAADALGEMQVEIEWQGRTLGVPLAQLRGVGINEETAEAMADWHYWVTQGRQF